VLLMYSNYGTTMNAATYITDLSARGIHHFTTEQAAEALGVSLVACRAALRRLRKNGNIVTPYRGFQVIVPPEHRSTGCLPAAEFVPQLMDHLSEPYYAGLLTAGAYHGAAHQRPMVFQAVTGSNRPGIDCGKVRVRFIARRNVDEIPVIRRNTARGYLSVSSPEATAFDLVGYYKHCGHLDNVATVLAELAEKLDAQTLAEIAPLSPLPWAQRLGYLLDLVGQRERADPMSEYVGKMAREYKLLRLDGPERSGERKTRWKLIVNEAVEPDL
jgi:predicted transcriptional regulator of viral defense system